MRWQGRRGSTNIEDRRGMGGVVAGGGIGALVLGLIAMGSARARRTSCRSSRQADCFAGVWAQHSQRQWQFLEPGDIEEGLAAASAVGDDRLQRQGQGYVVPESFTHGTSEQRMRWFQTGFQSGDPRSCDTFATSRL